MNFMARRSAVSSSEVAIKDSYPVPEKISIETEMKRSYLNYSMSVIISRAVPDVRDGLKPVHRRILYAMAEEKCDFDRPYRKSARIVGEVLGKYHPHGDQPIYEAMARMAQDFSMRLPLVDGQGNFGSMDGDKPAASRYTEARLSQAAQALLEDYDKEVVDFLPNYDNTLMMPAVLPAKFPNVLVNGAHGIAVGMATSIPPHNPMEILRATLALIDTPDLELEALMTFIPGPDFPTGGIILGQKNIRKAYETGHGSVMVRARYVQETLKKDRHALVFQDIPYQANKARIMEQIADLVNKKTIEGIHDLRDESTYEGVRIVIELKKEANKDLIVRQIFAHTDLQSSLTIHLLVIDQGQPMTLGLGDILRRFLVFREEVIQRKAQFFLRNAREKYHTLIGLVVAVSHIGEVIRCIREAETPQQAREILATPVWSVEELLQVVRTQYGKSAIQNDLEPLATQGYKLTDVQTKAILDLRLNRLTGLERNKLLEDLNGLSEDMNHYIALLQSKEKRMNVIKTELQTLLNLWNMPRLTEIQPSFDVSTDSEESLIPREDMVVTVTLRGYIKRVPLSIYKAQKRGGKGKTGMQTRDEDEVAQVFVASTHTVLLCVSQKGMAYRLKVHQLPLSSTQGKGKPLVGLLSLSAGDQLATLLALPEDISSWSSWDIVFATSLGHIRRNALIDFDNIRPNGKIAMKFDETEEQLVGVKLCSIHQDIALVTRLGQLIRFGLDDLRQFSGRTSMGVRGIRLQTEDSVIALSILERFPITISERDAYFRYLMQQKYLEDDDDKDSSELDEAKNFLSPTFNEIESQESVEILECDSENVLSEERLKQLEKKEQWILTISAKGFGKRTSSYAYRLSGRGGQGVAAMDLSLKTGPLIAALPVGLHDDVLLLTSAGRLIRCRVSEIRLTHRKARGVMLCRLDSGENSEFIVSAFALPEDILSESSLELEEPKMESSIEEKSE
jgi:DNA gyrase subunit A